ncbi:Proteasome subunit [Arachis hypogaea]|nr:Proteasome subunit [Arachis hypogaea]
MPFVFLDPFLDYPSFLSLGKLCIKMKMYKRSIKNATLQPGSTENGNRVVKETRDSSGKHARDYTVLHRSSWDNILVFLCSSLGFSAELLGMDTLNVICQSINQSIQGLQEKRILQALHYRVAHFSAISSDEHHKIQATVEDDLITTFIHQLKEGDVFIISDFKVKPNRGLVRVTRHRFRILFKCSTSVVAVASTVIPNPGLSLTSMNQIPWFKSNFYEPDSLERPPVVILQSFKIKVNRDKVSLQNVINISRVLINPDMQKTVNFLNQYGIASHHFSRLCSNEVGDLVCVIDDESFDWKLIRTIDNLKENNEDGQFFMVGKIKEIVEDPECYRIKILVKDGTSCGMFVLDSAATKLLGRTCSDVFLLLEDEMDDVNSDSAFSPIFENFSQYGQLRSYDNQVISGVPIQLHSIKEMLADILCAKIYSSTSRNICFLIGEIIDVLKHQKWWYYCCLCNAPVSHVGNIFYCYLCRVECVDAIRRYWIKIIVSHSNGSNIFILENDESKDDYTVPNSMISQLMNKKIVFIVDPRPVGYELNTSLHVVHAICDDIDIVKFSEDSTHNQQQKFHLDPFVPHFPFEFKNPVEFQSNASIQCSSSSSPPVDQVSPISVLNWNCWMINHDFHARILSSQGSNLFENHQPLTIREELRSAFGQCENIVEAVERMDECLYGSILRYKSIERLKPIGKYSVLGASGGISDFQQILRYLDELILNVTIFSRSALGAILAARAVFVCGVVDLNVDFELELCRVFDLMRFRGSSLASSADDNSSHGIKLDENEVW